MCKFLGPFIFVIIKQNWFTLCSGSSGVLCSWHVGSRSAPRNARGTHGASQGSDGDLLQDLCRKTHLPGSRDNFLQLQGTYFHAVEEQFFCKPFLYDCLLNNFTLITRGVRILNFHLELNTDSQIE